MNKLIYILLYVLLISCQNSDSNKNKVTLTSDNYSYIIFGQFSNNNNSRWKQLYKISGDSVWLYFKGGQYFDYSKNSWTKESEDNISNQLLTDSIANKRIFPLLTDVPKLLFQFQDSIIGDSKTLDRQGMYIEIGNNKQKRIWKINELDKRLPLQIETIDNTLIHIIAILEDDEIKD